MGTRGGPVLTRTRISAGRDTVSSGRGKVDTTRPRGISDARESMETTKPLDSRMMRARSACTRRTSGTARICAPRLRVTRTSVPGSASWPGKGD